MPTGTRSTRPRRWSSCSSTVCSHGRCSTRSTTADYSLAELDPRAARAGVDDEARRRLGRVSAELEFLHLDEAMDDLPALLARLQHECADVHAAIARRYFRETRVIEWSV